MKEVAMIVETSLFICSANQWTGFYMIGTSVMKELKNAHNCQITIFFKKLMSWQPSSITGSAIIMCIIFLFTIKLKLSQRHVCLPITLENVWARVSSTGLTSLEKLRKKI